jgi:hypothetical protein
MASPLKKISLNFLAKNFYQPDMLGFDTGNMEELIERLLTHQMNRDQLVGVLKDGRLSANIARELAYLPLVLDVENPSIDSMEIKVFYNDKVITFRYKIRTKGDAVDEIIIESNDLVASMSVHLIDYDGEYTVFTSEQLPRPRNYMSYLMLSEHYEIISDIVKQLLREEYY